MSRGFVTAIWIVGLDVGELHRLGCVHAVCGLFYIEASLAISLDAGGAAIGAWLIHLFSWVLSNKIISFLLYNQSCVLNKIYSGFENDKNN